MFVNFTEQITYNTLGVISFPFFPLAITEYYHQPYLFYFFYVSSTANMCFELMTLRS